VRRRYNVKAKLTICRSKQGVNKQSKRGDKEKWARLPNVYG